LHYAVAIANRKGGVGKILTAVRVVSKTQPVSESTDARRAGLDLKQALQKLGRVAHDCCAMLTAIFAAHLHKGWFASTPGPELPPDEPGRGCRARADRTRKLLARRVDGARHPDSIGIALAVLPVIRVAFPFVTRTSSGRAQTAEAS
jgi:hypothetical protein